MTKINHDLICDISQIILPFEYIIIQVILYFEFNDQSGGGLNQSCPGGNYGIDEYGNQVSVAPGYDVYGNWTGNPLDDPNLNPGEYDLPKIEGGS